ncbi:MAG TPA: PbrT family lead (Pb2+) uptake porter, partial [Nocardioides sp.]|nr:PbrT family lead (Pb2+) uptake porter [Nocardioides sp.]
MKPPHPNPNPKAIPMRSALPVAALLAVPLLAACTANTTDSGSAAGAGGPITVTASDESCDLSAASAPAGNLTFDVTNNGSKVTEFYLYSADGKRIVGEVENIGP